jgi:hypothetical protein
MRRRISTIISGTWPVARGSMVGGSTPRASYAAPKARSFRYATCHQGTPSPAATARILSSMSVTLRAIVTAVPVCSSQRRSTSTASPERR